jgi:hypothetical protein
MCSLCEIIIGESVHSIRNLEVLLKNDPTYDKASFLLVAAYFTSGQHDKGMGYAKKLKDKKPVLISYLSEFAHLLAAHQRKKEAQLLFEAVKNINNLQYC